MSLMMAANTPNTDQTKSLATIATTIPCTNQTMGLAMATTTLNPDQTICLTEATAITKTFPKVFPVEVQEQIYKYLFKGLRINLIRKPLCFPTLPEFEDSFPIMATSRLCYVGALTVFLRLARFKISKEYVFGFFKTKIEQRPYLPVFRLENIALSTHELFHIIPALKKGSFPKLKQLNLLAAKVLIRDMETSDIVGKEDPEICSMVMEALLRPFEEGETFDGDDDDDDNCWLYMLIRKFGEIGKVGGLNYSEEGFMSHEEKMFTKFVNFLTEPAARSYQILLRIKLSHMESQHCDHKIVRK